jgi:hypothetical protein
MATYCTIDKIRFDEMFLELSKVIPQDAVDFVREETARLAEECANQVSQLKVNKGGIGRDVRKVFAPLPKNAFTDPKKINGHGMKWLSAGDTWLIGVKPLRYHIEDSAGDMRNLFYKSKLAMPAEKRIEIGVHGGQIAEIKKGGRYKTVNTGKQRVYELQRLVVKRGTFKKFIQLLESHIGRLQASFAQTAQYLRGRAKVKAIVSRHFPSQANIHQPDGLANTTAPGVTFGSFAPGVENYETAVDLALSIRTDKMFQRWQLIISGYAKEMNFAKPPVRMAAITEGIGA